MEQIEYGQEYYDGLLKQYSKTAADINHVRWLWVQESSPSRILDFGCGIGWFRAYAPAGYDVDTFDLMPVPQTGIRHTTYDLVTFWDVIEHLDDTQLGSISGLIITAKHIALTVPIYSGDQSQLKNWKHYKPGEHIRYFFTEDAVEELFGYYGFRCIKHGYVECPPRQDICSFLFKNENPIYTN